MQTQADIRRSVPELLSVIASATAELSAILGTSAQLALPGIAAPAPAPVKRPGRPPKATNGEASKATTSGRAKRIDVAAVAEKVYGFISDNRDKGVARADITKTFGISDAQAGTVKAHLESRIKVIGDKRAARYFPADHTPKASEAKPAKTKSKAKPTKKAGKKK